MLPVPTDPQRSSAPRPALVPNPSPDNLTQIVSDLAVTIGRLEGLTTALEAIAHPGEAAAARHISDQVRNVRFRIRRISDWTEL